MNAKTIMTVPEMANKNKWLKIRNMGIGGSDAAIVIGLNRYKSAFKLWLEKTGQAEPEDLSDNEYVYWGTVLEQVVADRFCELTDKKVHRAGTMQSIRDDWLLANVDCMVVGEDAGLECKTCNGFAAKDWQDDKLPDAYYIQCQHYMLVTGCSKWYIACLIGGNHFVYKEIQRYDNDIDALYKAEKHFWTVNVLQKIMPQVDGSDDCSSALADKFKGGNAEPVILSDDASKILTQLDDLKSSASQIKTAIQENKNKLCEMLGNNEVGYVGDRKITWKVQDGRVTVDTKRLRTEIPDIFKKYSKVGKTTRIFRY